MARHVLGPLGEQNRHARLRDRTSGTSTAAGRQLLGQRHHAVQREVAAERRLGYRQTGCQPPAAFAHTTHNFVNRHALVPASILGFPHYNPARQQERPGGPRYFDRDRRRRPRRPGRYRAPGRPAAGRPRRHRQGHLWPAGCHRSNAGCAPVGRPPAADRRAGPRQDQAGRDPGRRAGHGRQAHPVHARPDAGRHPGLGSDGGKRRRPPLLPLHRRARCSPSC